MYGAGRSMQDMLESGKGLPLDIHITLTSTFHVISNFLKPTFHQQVRCSLLLNTSYDNKRTSTKYKSNCVILWLFILQIFVVLLFHSWTQWRRHKVFLRTRFCIIIFNVKIILNFNCKMNRKKKRISVLSYEQLNLIE